jgi:ribosome recycling factor
MINKTLTTTEQKMKASLEGLKTELSTIRTGRASPSLVEHLKVDYVGTLMPLNQLATISAPEARLIVIQPWDKSALSAIVKGIQKSDLSLNPMSDGNVIRLAIPPLTEERRQELVKLVKKRIEERKVIIRQIRQDTLNNIRTAEKNKEISQDESKRAQDQLQKLTDRTIEGVEIIGKDKGKELSEV